jgi:hypothetical protein
MFYKLKRFLFFLLFFYYSFSFALQKWFLELKVASHKILNHSEWSTYDEDINKHSVIDSWSVMDQFTLLNFAMSQKENLLLQGIQ